MVKFYLDPPQAITHDFWEQRPAGPHHGWDHAGSTHAHAPEMVDLHLQIIRQYGEYKPDFAWPNGSWWPYSRYYEWWTGGVAIAFGAEYTYVFMHLDPDWIYEKWRATWGHATQKKRMPGNFRSYATLEVNWTPIKLKEGEFLCQSGTSGFDDSPHLHVQVMKRGRDVHEYVDPATVWPEIYAQWCANKTVKGG